MTPIIIHPILFYIFLGFAVIISFYGVWITWIFIKRYVGDLLLFIDKTNRWKIVYEKLKGASEYTHNDKKYFLSDKTAILNSKGKAFFIFSENKPEPMKISYNDNKWVTSDSLLAIINNKLIQQLVKTTSELEDKLILFGAIGGMIAGVSSVLILLKQFGVI